MMKIEKQKLNNSAAKEAEREQKKSQIELPYSLRSAEKKLLNFYKKEVAVLKKIRHPYGKSYIWIKTWEKLFA